MPGVLVNVATGDLGHRTSVRPTLGRVKGYDASVFNFALLAQQQRNRLVECWEPAVPGPNDEAGWERFIAEVHEARSVLFALYHPGGFKKIHETLPSEEWMYAVVPSIEQAVFVGSYFNTVQYPLLRGHLIVD